MDPEQEKYFKKLFTKDNKSQKLNKIYQKIKRFIPGIAFLLVITIVYIILIQPPHYNPAETESNKQALFNTLLKNDAFSENVISALSLIEKEDKTTFEAIVNNLANIKINPEQSVLALTSYPQNQITFAQKFSTPLNSQADLIFFSGILVHEGNHLEYLNSSRIRKLLLGVKCSVVFNPKYFFSTIPSIEHHILPEEICAFKVQEKFYEKF